jgi:hypothetical protein
MDNIRIDLEVINSREILVGDKKLFNIKMLNNFDKLLLTCFINKYKYISPDQVIYKLFNIILGTYNNIVIYKPVCRNYYIYNLILNELGKIIDNDILIVCKIPTFLEVIINNYTNMNIDVIKHKTIKNNEIIDDIFKKINNFTKIQKNNVAYYEKDNFFDDPLSLNKKYNYIFFDTYKNYMLDDNDILLEKQIDYGLNNLLLGGNLIILINYYINRSILITQIKRLSEHFQKVIFLNYDLDFSSRFYIVAFNYDKSFTLNVKNINVFLSKMKLKLITLNELILSYNIIIDNEKLIKKLLTDRSKFQINNTINFIKHHIKIKLNKRFVENIHKYEKKYVKDILKYNYYNFDLSLKKIDVKMTKDELKSNLHNIYYHSLLINEDLKLYGINYKDLNLYRNNLIKSSFNLDIIKDEISNQENLTFDYYDNLSIFINFLDKIKNNVKKLKNNLLIKISYSDLIDDNFCKMSKICLYYKKINIIYSSKLTLSENYFFILLYNRFEPYNNNNDFINEFYHRFFIIINKMIIKHVVYKNKLLYLVNKDIYKKTINNLSI